MAAGKKVKEERTDASGRVLYPWEVDPADQASRGDSAAPADVDGGDTPPPASDGAGEQASV